MKILNENIGKAELLAMIVFTSGCIVDHITTYYGLSMPTIKEANPVVLLMIGAGIWNVVEILIIAMGTTSGFILSSTKSRRIVTMSIFALMAVGLVRLYAGVNNIVLITNVGRILEITSVIP
jgi:hypothetical protein